MLGVIIKFLIPFTVIYFIVKVIRQIFWGENIGARQDSNVRYTKKASKSDNVIDICPECGNIMSNNHQCIDKRA